MKNIITHNRPEDARDFIRGLWRTDSFKTSPYIQNWVARVQQRRPWFFEMTHPKLEWSHFTSYLGGIALREYDNPVIQDLYYLHELIHVATMPYLPGIDFYSWRTGVLRNELTASMHSEVYAYFEMPDLRQDAFAHEIWADRFLEQPRWQQFYALNTGAAQERLRRERKLVSTNPNPSDFVEQQIAGYFQTNLAWAEIWREIYPNIVVEMDRYTRGEIPPEQHKKWVIDCFGPGYPIPFDKQADNFSRIYYRNKEILGNQKLINEQPS